VALTDENAFGVLIGYHGLENDEYSLEPTDFVARFTTLREVVRESLLEHPLARGVCLRELGHAAYLEFADGEQSEEPIAWIKRVRERLKAREIESIGVLTHGGRWLDEPALGSRERRIGEATLLSVSLPSEPFRRALYAETASVADEDSTSEAWGAGVYVDTEAIEALGRTLKNAPTPLGIAGATFYRISR
jgi:hypothetical protein